MSTELPWDRFEPDQPEPPAPERPPTAPAPGPTPPVRPPSGPVAGGDTDTAIAVRDLAQDLLSEALSYAKDSVGAIWAGKDVDVLHPTVTAETSTGRELIVADAKSRSWRTFVQGLAIDLFAALIALVSTLTNFDPFDKAAWTTVAALGIKTLIQTVMAYVMRMRITPTIRTEGEKLALMPVPRPMIKDEENRP